MCSVELKDKIYEAFDSGLDPQQVIVKLNIPGEKKVVWGCYTYYKNKAQNDFLSKELNYSDKLAKEQREAVASIAKIGRQLLNVTKEIANIDCVKKSEDYTFARQVLLHDIESGKYSKDVLGKIQSVSMIRRNFKDMTNIDEKITKVKKDINNVVVALENILPYLQVDASNGADLFVGNRMKNADEYRSELISAIR